jgi:hypothetical protein
MSTQLNARVVRRAATVGSGLAVLLGLTGCYVMPIDNRPVPMASPAVITPAPPAGPVVLSARLYPANEKATRHGVVAAYVSNDLQGQGRFTAMIGAESFSGEATRESRSSREGVASGIGHRGGYLSCRYAMNSSTQGTGRCQLSDGAEFTMHLSQ